VKAMSSLNFLQSYVLHRDVPPCLADEEVVEIPLLLTGRQAEALEITAHDNGVTTGELVRQLLEDYLARKTNS